MVNMKSRKVGKLFSLFQKKPVFWLSIVVFVVVLLDYVTKYLVQTYMTVHETIPLIKDVFHLTYVQNTGAGFSILKGQNSLLLLVSLVIIGFLLWYWYTSLRKESVVLLPVGLIIGGAVGNVIDRITLGHVVDFLDFRVWPVFNVADSGITIGAILLFIYLWKK